MDKDPAVFISYRRNDTKWFAAMLGHNIEQQLPGVKLFLDVLSIEPGLDFESILNKTLDKTEVQLVLIGKNWLTTQDQAGRRRLDIEDDWVRVEIARALERNIRVIPILVDGADMPKAEFLPTPLVSLSRRQNYSVNFENHQDSIFKILSILSQIFATALDNSSSEHSSTQPRLQPTATTMLEIFDEGTTDDETLTVLGEQQLDKGRFGLARGIFELIKIRKFAQIDGPPDLDVCRAKYQVGLAKLLDGEFVSAVKDFTSILPYIEMERDESYPLYVKTQAALARAYLELGEKDKAKSALPTFRGILFRDQSLTAIDLWIAHLENKSALVKELTAKLDSELQSHPPTVEFAKSISRLRETLSNSQVKSTMMWYSSKFF